MWLASWRRTPFPAAAAQTTELRSPPKLPSELPSVTVTADRESPPADCPAILHVLQSPQECFELRSPALEGSAPHGLRRRSPSGRQSPRRSRFRFDSSQKPSPERLPFPRHPPSLRSLRLPMRRELRVQTTARQMVPRTCLSRGQPDGRSWPSDELYDQPTLQPIDIAFDETLTDYLMTYVGLTIP